MKHKMWSRLLSMVLAVMMITSIVPNSAFAEVAEAAGEVVASSQQETGAETGTEPQSEVTVLEENVPAVETDTVGTPAAETDTQETPAAAPTQAPATAEPSAEPAESAVPQESTVPNEQPSAEPAESAVPEESATPQESAEPTATPAPSESPAPTATPEATEEPAAIDGQALLDELMAIEDDEAFMQAVSELTDEQTAALEALGEEALADYALRVETLTATQQQEEKFTELYDKLMAAESIQEIEELLNGYSDEELNTFVSFLGETKYAELKNYITLKASEEQEAPVSKVFTDAGPLMPAVNVGRQLFRAFANFLNADDGDDGKDALKISKTLEGWDWQAGTGTLVLEAYAAGEYKTEVVEESVPVDIVLVLDQSGSMKDDFPGAANRQAALKQAVNNFIIEVSKKYGEKSDHRMAIVNFGSNSSVLAGWTEMNTQGAQKLYNSVNSLPGNPSGATNVASGMQTAENLLIGDGYSYTGENTTRHKVVIVFTDGVPTINSDFNTGVANTAIQCSYNMKNAGVTVYSIGIFQGVDAEQLFGASGFDTNSNGTVGSKWIKDTWGFFPGTDFPEADIPAANRFLNYLSSNFINATNVGLDRNTRGLGILHYKITYEITENFERSNNTYYLTATDQKSLNQIFETIKEEIGSGSTSVTLDEESVVRDVMSPFFNVNANEKVKVYAVPSTGVGADGEFQFDEDEKREISNAATVEGDTVEVTGFDFSTRYVAEEVRENPQTQTENYYGEKLRIEIPITVDYTKTLGGNDIPTNDISSGIYMTKDSTTPEKTFESPKADVKINYGFTTSDTSIYVQQSQDLKNLISENVTHNGTKVPVDGTTNKYVNITYQVYDGTNLVGTYKIDAGKTVGTWTEASSDQLSECTEYTIKCTVTPSVTKVTGGVDDWTDEQTATVHVFVPEITWKDGTVKYNETLTKEYLEGRRVSVVWADSKSDDGTEPVGGEPVLTYGFVKDGSSLVDTKVTSDINVSVKVFYGDGTEITGYTRFKWVKDTDKGNVCDDTCTQPTTGFQFRIHVGTGDLTIAKTLNNFNASKGEKVTFLFEVKNVGTNQKYYQAISFSANEVGTKKTVTIKNLPSGTYEVTELAADGYSVVDGSNVISDLVVGTQEPAEAVFTNRSNGDNKPGDNEFANNQFTYDGMSWTWERAS